MLMRFDARSTRGVFAEVQEAADFVAEISKRSVIDASLSRGCLPHDIFIISYYDIIVRNDSLGVSASAGTVNQSDKRLRF
jgi:hypothetical protein